MKKLSLSICLLLCFILGSCAATQQKEGSVNPKIENIYMSSVTVKDNFARTYGSGTIIYNKAGQQMFVLTAAHVVSAILKENKQPCVSTAYDTGNHLMTVYKIDKDKDLALLSSKERVKKNGPYVNIATYAPNIGDSVWVIGAPLGADRTVTRGIISNFKSDKKKALYRTTADTFFGNSGGGMFNDNGELVGVAHALIQVRIGFSILNVPGGFFFIALKTIKVFM